MKTLRITAVILSFSVLLAQAETTVTLTGVHNCCRSCTNGITKAATSVKDVTVVAEGKTVKLTAKSKSSAKKAVEAILAAGYFGISDAVETGASPRTSSASSASKKLSEATVSGVHLCCKKCSDAMISAIQTVPGVKEHTVASKATSFTVKGEFTEAELVAAMNKAGFHGKIAP